MASNFDSFGKFITKFKDKVKDKKNEYVQYARWDRQKFDETRANLVNDKVPVLRKDVNPPYSWAEDIHPNGIEHSTYVDNISYEDGTLKVTFRDGATCIYDNITPEQLKDFVGSDSKGRWVHNNLWDLPYRTE